MNTATPRRVTVAAWLTVALLPIATACGLSIATEPQSVEEPASVTLDCEAAYAAWAERMTANYSQILTVWESGAPYDASIREDNLDKLAWQLDMIECD